MAGLAGALVASPALAQAVDPNQPFNDGSAAASVSSPPGVVAPGYDPGTRAANVDMGQALAADMASVQARQHAELQRYHQALKGRAQTIAMIRTTQARREAAYGRAMDAWHAQVAACQDGNRQACLAPTPDPAAFE
ncbi:MULTISPECIES: hypothetical protein [unclassified Novosphingobium]|uniref:hypothetical protein n=1 Tax=Novosphingobium TaxID=165696 RepID=UPI00144743E2|nr:MULTISPECIES: hypothetical protein [unclassified Novosphingobium]NKJ41616.1 hypothetical protein [Novosphingobium sp. SG720]NMN04000.1 hypothetical protein [Novosphingobium sp. SG919]NMN86010.1 hypothetical protein [Novosphingobium sp. SG916]